jgi:hypothetical protein
MAGLLGIACIRNDESRDNEMEIGADASADIDIEFGSCFDDDLDVEPDESIGSRTNVNGTKNYDGLNQALRRWRAQA